MGTCSDHRGGMSDVVTLVEAFLEDETRHVLELPSLTAVQRKQAKSFVEQHFELTCESFGFGAERLLHVFKKAVESSAQCNQHGVNDAKYFGVVEKSPRVGVLDLTSIAQRPSELYEDARAASQSSSTTASTSSSSAASPEGSPREFPAASSESNSSISSPVRSPRVCMAQLPPLPNGLQLRKTFIDIEDEQVVVRQAKSMPHGMFGHYLNAELDERHVVFSRKSSVSSGSSDEEAVLAPGVQVMIEGLQKMCCFNGATGTVQSIDEESGRFNILLAVPANGHKWAKVKLENLRVVSEPSPPPFKPTLPAMDDGDSILSEIRDLQGCPSTPTWDDYAEHCMPPPYAHQNERINITLADSVNMPEWTGHEFWHSGLSPTFPAHDALGFSPAPADCLYAVSSAMWDEYTVYCAGQAFVQETVPPPFTPTVPPLCEYSSLPQGTGDLYSLPPTSVCSQYSDNTENSCDEESGLSTLLLATRAGLVSPIQVDASPSR